MFLIPLRNVDEKSRAETVKDQLDLDEESTYCIERVLNGKNKGKTLIILDGYDEYTKGTNKDIDNLIKSPVSNCFLLLTSRFGEYLSKTVRKQMDGEIEIKGFSKENIKKCSSKYLGSDEVADDFLEQAEESQIYELLHIPIVLLMSCLVFTQKDSLPKTQTELFRTAREIVIDRTTLKTFGKTSSELEKLESWLEVLDKMSWEALQSNEQQLLLDKVGRLKIEEISAYAHLNGPVCCPLLFQKEFETFSQVPLLLPCAYLVVGGNVFSRVCLE